MDLHTIADPMLTLHSLEEKFQKSMEVFEARFTSASSTVTLNQLSSDFQQFKAFVCDTFSLLRAQISSVAAMTDDLENRSRRKFLLIRGIKESPIENIPQTVSSFTTNMLKMDVCPEDIVFGYRLGKSKNSDKPRPILVKFLSSEMRSKIWRSKKLLKGTDTSIAEFLTQNRRQIYNEGRRVYGMRNCWSQEGKVYIKLPNGDKISLQSVNHLKELSSKHPPAQPEAQKKIRPTRTGKQQK